MNIINQFATFFKTHKKNYFLVVLFLFLNIFVYSQKEQKMLNKAYKSQSTEKLKIFFETWSLENPSMTDAELLTCSDTIQQAYNLFIAFYKPGGKEFLITKNTIIIQFTEKISCSEQDIIDMLVQSKDSITLKKIEQEDSKNILNEIVDSYLPGDNCRTHEILLTHTITDFRPAFYSNGKTRLFLTKKYDEILKQFLGLNEGSTISIEEKEKRKEFLEHYVAIYHYTHWGEYWQLYSYPTFSKILFDKDMKYAIIWSGGVGSGSELVFKRNGEIWEYVASRGSWTH